MKFLLTLLLLLSAISVSANDVYVRGYTKSNGTYVSPHYRTAPDSTPYNNYSTKGNTNPYTGKQGTVNPINSLNSNTRSNYGNPNTTGTYKRY
jgi:hypothetical protein